MGKSSRSRYWKSTVVVFALVFVFNRCDTLWSQTTKTQTGFLHKTFEDKAGTHKYVLFIPHSYTPQKKWPVILFLHGAGERGIDGLKQAKVGLGPAIQKRKSTFPFIVVFPQSEDTKGPILPAWQFESPQAKRALKILKTVEKAYSIDPSKRILTGLSMGGYGAWSVAAATPEKWSAVVPICGGGDPKTAGKLKSLPIWAFHGAEDKVVLPAESRKMIAAIKNAGGNPHLTIVPGVGHNVWNNAYANETLYRWMSNPKDVNPAEVRLTANPGRRPVLAADESLPFKPALEIMHAVNVRLGNDILKAFSYTVPRKIAPELLKGDIDDIYDSTVTQGRTFDVQFSNISYNAKLERAVLKATRGNRLQIQLGLKNATLTIDRTYVTGRRRSAVAGEIQVVLGNRRPVWLSITLEPVIDKKKFRFKLISKSFQIPDDNWYVTSPNGVSTRGLGMTSQRVSSGLVDGLYGSKSRIEREVLAVVPKIVERLQKEIEIPDASSLISQFWPLPVYRPRVKIWPESLSSDDNGISLSFGLSVAAIDPEKAPTSPRRIALANSLNNFGKSRKLQIGIAGNLLEPLTKMLVDADVARIHVNDIPDKTFAGFADYETLSKAVPELRRYGKDVQIWSELILSSPISIVSEKKPALTKVSLPNGHREKTPSRFQFHVPRAIISIAVKKNSAEKNWIPFVEFDFDLSQRAQLSAIEPSFEKREILLDWNGAPSLKANARFADGYRADNSAIDHQAIRQLFLESWQAWTSQGPANRSTIEDLDFGFSKLRLADASWRNSRLTVTFEEAGIRISNGSKLPLVYETKGPYSGWGGPYTLPPGESHDFNIPYSLIYRRKIENRYQLFTLPVGSHSVFRAPEGGGTPTLFQAKEPTPNK